MDQSEAVNLIKEGMGLPSLPQNWADLGCGKGIFTEALASLLPNQSVVYAIDKNSSALNAIPDTLRNVNIKKYELDFHKEDLPFHNVDGILMANSLHYVKKKESFLKKLSKYFSKKGSLIIVEYEAMYSNPWVPFPVSRIELIDIMTELQFSDIQNLGNMNSRYGHLIYSMSCSPG